MLSALVFVASLLALSCRSRWLTLPWRTTLWAFLMCSNHFWALIWFPELWRSGVWNSWELSLFEAWQDELTWFLVWNHVIVEWIVDLVGLLVKSVKWSYVVGMRFDGGELVVVKAQKIALLMRRNWTFVLEVAVCVFVEKPINLVVFEWWGHKVILTHCKFFAKF